MDSTSVSLLPTEEATIKRLLSHPNVEGLILTNNEGQPQYSSFDNNVTFLVTSRLLSFTHKARETIRDLDPTDDLITLRLRTRTKEMLVATPEDGMPVIGIQRIASSTAQHAENE